MTGIASIAVRFALYLDLMLLFGVPAFAVLIHCGRRDDDGFALRPTVAACAVVGLALSAAGIALLAASMSGVAVAALDFVTIRMVVTGTATGTAWLVRVAVLLLALVVALAGGGRRLGGAALMLCGAIALATLAWQGHGVMDDGRTGIVHLVADIGHIVAAGIWVGALAALAIMAFQPADRLDAERLAYLHSALAGFARVGTFAVRLIVVTGLVNAWLLVGPDHVRSLGATVYGQLLLAKLALFALMLLLAALNRFSLVPALGCAAGHGNVGAAIRALRLSLALETASAVTILGLVAWLGTLAPPASPM